MNLKSAICRLLGHDWRFLPEHSYPHYHEFFKCSDCGLYTWHAYGQRYISGCERRNGWIGPKMKHPVNKTYTDDEFVAMIL